MHVCADSTVSANSLDSAGGQVCTCSNIYAINNVTQAVKLARAAVIAQNAIRAGSKACANRECLCKCTA